MIRLAIASTLIGGTLAAQAASSTFFVPAAETGAGGTGTSVTWKLTGSFGSGVVAHRSGSATFAIEGGFPAAVTAPVTGRPWLSGVAPLFAPLKGGTALTLRGTELHVATGVTIGAKSAAIVSRTRAEIRTTLPAQEKPGWTSVTVNATAASSTLPRGIGVLPLLDMPRPAEARIPVEVTFHGTQGDAVVWMLARGNGPFPIPIASFHHAFELNLLTLIVLAVTPVTSPSGRVSLPLPAVRWRRPMHFQCLSITANPGYAPGCFTNVQKL